MREIKFRAWDKQSRIWLDDDEYVIKPDSGLVSEIDYAEGYVVIAADNHDAILEEFTGLKDKNGVEIYEGDIICQQMRFVETNGVIFWQEDKARFAVNLDGFITTITKPQEHSYEVIGNIHENADLLDEQS
ncbi:YopX family protein [Leuconostoc pseudomesenteroides]|uniref:YopX family protein n=1 Tax=Leuconostoc pseudomesenteroides TaxID=33968 RepID=UPI0039EAED23